MRQPGLIHAESFRNEAFGRVVRQLPDGSYALARPEPYESVLDRVRLAWMVFTGRADALVWKQQ